MRSNSIFGKYFALVSVCVFSCILVTGGVLTIYASHFVKQEKYDLLEQNARQAAIITANNYLNSGDGNIEQSVISLAYSILSRSVGADFFLTDVQGNTIFCERCEQGEEDNHYTNVVPPDVVAKVLMGKYEETALLGGIYDDSHYTVGVPVVVRDRTIAMMFVSAPAIKLEHFLYSLAEMFVLCAITVLGVALIAVYFFTMGLIRPLKEMVSATQSFSEGDFSRRVPVAAGDEIGQLAMSFNNMASSLATTETSRRSFVANVSHELKTPMTTIGGFVDGILDGTVPEEKRDQYMQVVSQEIKRLSRLVRSMLDTARIEAGEMQIQPAVFDISELIRQTVFTFERSIEEHETEIRGLETDKIMVFADRDLLHQVVYNLVENAVKFVNTGGYIAFDYHTEGKMIKIGIINSGEGIDKEEASHLFERFYKSDKSRSLNKSGVGLGLHIARSIIKYHKGDITVSSVEGEYTRFEFMVPAVPKN